VLAIEFPNPPLDRVNEIDVRLREMSLANAQRGVHTLTYSTQTVPLALTLLRQGSSVSVLEWSQRAYIDGSSFVFSNTQGMRRLNYHFLQPYQERGSTLLLTDPIWNNLPENRPAVLEYSILRHSQDEELIAFVDDVIVTSFSQTRPLPSNSGDMERRCGTDKNGESRSEIRTFIMEAGTFNLRELDESGAIHEATN
jgi:hypothetical protein